MFLYVFEDGDVAVRAALREGDLQSVENGFLQIIDISDPAAPVYLDGTAVKVLA